MSQEHFQTMRDVKKNLSDIEYFVLTAQNADTLGEIESLLKTLGNKAQTKRQKLVNQQKDLKKD